MRLFLIAVMSCVLAAATASAQERRDGGGGYHGGGHRQYYHERRPGYTYAPGYGWYNPSAVVGGAIGGWLYRQFNPPPEPPVVVVQQPEPAPVRTVGWCVDRYRSYDVVSRSYLGYDGYRHSCP